MRPSGNNSVVECDLAKVEVAGSNPVSRSNFQWQVASQKLGPSFVSLDTFHETPAPGLWRGTQVVRERSAKPLCVSSILTRASKLQRSAQFENHRETRRARAA